MKGLLLLVFAILAQNTLAYKLEEAQLIDTLKDVLQELEARNIIDSTEDAITDVDGALEELLSGEFSAIRSTAFKDLTEGELQRLMQGLVGIAFRATSNDMKGLVIARFAISMVDMFAYTKKTEYFEKDAAAMEEFWDRNKKSLKDAMRFMKRYPQARRLPSDGIAGTSQEWELENSGEFPYIFSPLDAVSILLIEPMDNLMSDLKTIISPEGADYVASVFYDLQDLLEEGLAEMTVEEFAPKVLEAMMYMVQTEGSAGDDVQEKVGERIMAYGQFNQDIEAKEAPPVINLGDQDQLMLVWKRIKPINKDLSKVVRNLAKSTEGGKTDNLVTLLGNFAANVLSDTVVTFRE